MRAFTVLFIASWIAGIALGTFGVSPAIGIASGAATALFLFWRRVRVPHIVVTNLLLFLGVMWGQAAAAPPPTCQLDSPLPGTVVEKTRIEAQRVQYVVKTSEGCRVLLTAGRFPEYSEGAHIVLDGKIRSLAHVAEDLPEYASYLSRKDISATTQYPTVTAVAEQASWVGSIRSTARGKVQKVFTEPEASLVLEMMLGQRGSLPTTTEDQFRHTGVSHILSISGLHISLVAAVLVGFFMVFPLHPLPGSAAVIGLLWMYVVLVGAPASAVRAASFWSLALISFRLGVLVSLPTVVAATVASVVSLDPNVLADIGFQLSVFAVVGIGLAFFVAKRLSSLRIHPVSGLLLTSAGATLFTWPLVLYYFGNISLTGVVANLFVVPASSLFLVLAALTLLGSLVLPSIAVVGGFLAHLLWRSMDIVTSLLDLPSVAYFDELSVPAWVVLLYYPIVVFCCWLILRRQGRSFREVWE